MCITVNFRAPIFELRRMLTYRRMCQKARQYGIFLGATVSSWYMKCRVHYILSSKWPVLQHVRRGLQTEYGKGLPYLYHWLDCPSCLAHMNRIGWATWPIWEAIKKYNLSPAFSHLSTTIFLSFQWLYLCVAVLTDEKWRVEDSTKCHGKDSPKWQNANEMKDALSLAFFVSHQGEKMQKNQRCDRIPIWLASYLRFFATLTFH